MRRDISSGLGQGLCDGGGTEERRGEIPLSMFGVISAKGSLYRKSRMNFKIPKCAEGRKEDTTRYLCASRCCSKFAEVWMIVMK
jgi:hypothetical protein